MSSSSLPFNPATYLYYFPELYDETRSGSIKVDTVERAASFYQDLNDPIINPCQIRYKDLQDLAGDSRWTIGNETYKELFPDSDFNGQLFLLQNMRHVNIVDLNASIIRAMKASGFTDNDIIRRSTFLDVFRKIVVVVKDTNNGRQAVINIDSVDATVLADNANLIRAGSRISLLRKPTRGVSGDQVLQMAVTGVTLDSVTGKLTQIQVSSATVPFDDNYAYYLQGIAVADVERLGRINFVRLVLQRLKANQSPFNGPPEIKLSNGNYDPDFNVELYRVLYPDTRLLSKEQCFLDYLANLNKGAGQVRIGGAQDIGLSGLNTAVTFAAANIEEDLTIGGTAIMEGNATIAGDLELRTGKVNLPGGALFDAQEGDVEFIAQTVRIKQPTNTNTVRLQLTQGAANANFTMLPIPSPPGYLSMSVPATGAILMGVGTQPDDHVLQIYDELVQVKRGDLVVIRETEDIAAQVTLCNVEGDFAGSVMLVGDDDEGLIGTEKGTLAIVGPTNIALGERGEEPTVNITNGRMEVYGDVGLSKDLIVTGTVEADSFFTVSDERLKKDIEPVTAALDKLESIRGYRYSLKNDKQGDNMHMGVMAQELLKVVPELVKEDSRGMYSVAYDGLSGLFVEAFREVMERLDRLERSLSPR
jgi:hypothetical protein